MGLATTVMDSGILGEPIGITLDEHDISRAQAAIYGGTTIEQLRNAGSRGKAVAGMREALKALGGAVPAGPSWPPWSAWAAPKVR